MNIAKKINSWFATLHPEKFISIPATNQTIQKGDFVIPNCGRWQGNICRVVACFPSISEIRIENHLGLFHTVAIQDISIQRLTI